MNKGATKALFVVSIVLIALVLAYFGYSRPGYFANQTNLAGLVFLEVMVAAVCFYRRVFFPLVIGAFLLAGMDLSVGSGWTTARWVVLGVGALVGLVLVLKERRSQFGLFHVLAFFSVLAALMSAAVSAHATVSALKVLSLFLLFVYGGTGARLAVANHENRFLASLLVGCEIFVAVVAAFYFLGRDVMGNPNSLGAVMGVVIAPILLWGTMLEQGLLARRRRLLLYVVSMYLIYFSHARAGILAVLISCALLCLALRKYSLLLQGVGVLAILIASGAILSPDAFSRAVSSFTSEVVYKDKDPSMGVLSSRESPWQGTIDTIRANFWFGTGFGTSDTEQEGTESIGRFASSSPTSTEHGSSYLAIVSWVGLLGVVPFALLLGVLLAKSLKSVLWMFRTANPNHPAFPLAIIMIAGLVHAAFEDWLFAPGYYLCVFYWSMAFVFVDQVMSLPVADAPAFVKPAKTAQQYLGAAVPNG